MAKSADRGKANKAPLREMLEFTRAEVGLVSVVMGLFGYRPPRRKAQKKLGFAKGELKKSSRILLEFGGG